MAPATLTMEELNDGIDETTNASAKKVLKAILNDFMALAYGVETPYTTGKLVIPTGCTIKDVDAAIADKTTKEIYRAVFERIAEKYRSGDTTPEKNNGDWDPKWTPILVLVS